MYAATGVAKVMTLFYHSSVFTLDLAAFKDTVITKDLQSEVEI